MTPFDIPLAALDGESLPALNGKVVPIVNVASKCGLTPQYAGLERLQAPHPAALGMAFSDVAFPRWPNRSIKSSRSCPTVRSARGFRGTTLAAAAVSGLWVPEMSHTDLTRLFTAEGVRA